MNKSQDTRTKIMVAILICLLIVGYRFVFVVPMDPVSEENAITSERLQKTLSDIESINFRASIAEDPAFQSLKDISTPLISLPVGRTNPFGASTRAQ